MWTVTDTSSSAKATDTARTVPRRVLAWRTWLALGLKTGVWLYPYLVGIPVLVLHFAAIYSFSVLLGVCTRSTVACIFGAVLFWLVCWGINLGRHYTLAMSTLAPGTPPSASGTIASWRIWRPSATACSGVWGMR